MDDRFISPTGALWSGRGWLGSLPGLVTNKEVILIFLFKESSTAAIFFFFLLASV
jgi:hypothetical protein